MMLLSDERLESGEFNINARPYVENLKLAAKAQAKKICDWLEEHNCQSNENPVFGLLLDDDDWQQLRKEIE